MTSFAEIDSAQDEFHGVDTTNVRTFCQFNTHIAANLPALFSKSKFTTENKTNSVARQQVGTKTCKYTEINVILT